MSVPSTLSPDAVTIVLVVLGVLPFASVPPRCSPSVPGSLLGACRRVGFPRKLRSNSVPALRCTGSFLAVVHSRKSDVQSAVRKETRSPYALLLASTRPSVSHVIFACFHTMLIFAGQLTEKIVIPSNTPQSSGSLVTAIRHHTFECDLSG